MNDARASSSSTTSRHPHVGVVGLAVQQHRGAGLRRHRPHPRVVGVEDGGAGPRAAPATSSALARATPSMPPTRSLCASATRVTTPIVGRAISHNAVDLAEPTHAHLEHHHLGVVGSVEHRGGQTLLVVEAASRWPTCVDWRRAPPTRGPCVRVLPTEPVMPMTGPSSRGRMAAASCISARSVSATSIAVPPCAGPMR